MIIAGTPNSNRVEVIAPEVIEISIGMISFRVSEDQFYTINQLLQAHQKGDHFEHEHCKVVDLENGNHLFCYSALSFAISPASLSKLAETVAEAVITYKETFEKSRNESQVDIEELLASIESHVEL